MSSIADTSTTLAVLQDSNNDVVELIKKLKYLLGGTDPVTFNMGKYTITVDGVQSLIDHYKNGQFDSLTIGGQTSGGKQVKLSVTADGALKVTDTSGALLPIDCASITKSIINNSTAKKVVAEDCEIKSIKGTSTISGGDLTLGSLNIAGETAASMVVGENVLVNNLYVTNAVGCSGVYCYGTRKLNISNIRNVFYKNGIINNDNLAVSSAISKNIWNVSAASGSPYDFGFSSNLERAPGMICVQGINEYSKYKAIRTPLNVKVVYQDNDIECDTYYLDFGAVMLWPTGYVDTEHNRAVLTPFTTEDSDKDIYYMTGGEPWTIYRTMAITDGIATFGNPYTIPAYSCMRFIIASRYVSNSMVSLLEIA